MSEAVQKDLRDYYWAVLKKITGIENGLANHMVDISPEAEITKAIAFAGLIRAGQEAKKDYRRASNTETKTKSFGMISLVSKQEEELPDELWIILQDEKRRDYSLKAALLEQVLGDDFRALIDGSESFAGPGAAQAVPIEVPDLDFDEEDLSSPENPRIDLTEIVKEEENFKETSVRLPKFVTDTHFGADPDGSKDGWSFWYNRHTVRLLLPEGLATIRFYVYPLSIKENEGATDIFVVAESEGLVRAGVSRGNTTSVNIDYEDIKFVVRASWKDKKLDSIVRCVNEELADSFSQEVRSFTPDPRTQTTYLRTSVQGVNLDIFPARYGENENTGYALAAIAVESENNIGITTPSADGTFIVDIGKDMPVMVNCFWQGTDPVMFYVEFPD